MTLSTTLSTLWSWPALLAVLTVVFVLIRRKKDDDGNIVHLDEHLFASAKTFGTFMEGGVMAKPAKSIHVYE